MGCACKVQTHINQIEKHYGTKVLPNKKTNITSIVRTFLKKSVIAIICVPFIPLILFYLGIRKMFTNKPIVLDNLITKKI